MLSAIVPDPTAAVVTRSVKGGKEAVKKINNNSTPVMAQDCKPPSSAEDQDDLLIATHVNISSEQKAGIAPGQLITPSLSTTDQDFSLSRDGLPTAAIAEALHVGSDHIAMDTFDESKGDDNTMNSQRGEGNENKNTGDDEEGKCGGDVDSSIILQSQPQDSRQNNHKIDKPLAIREEPQLLTRKLLASGGDIRALLSSDQTLSSLRAQTVDTGKVGAGQKIVNKDGEKEEVVQEERFVRPPRLRFALSKEAASDGFPSAIARSLRWHPDHMQDLPGDAATLSIRAAFDTKFDEYYVFRHWRPSQGR